MNPELNSYGLVKCGRSTLELSQYSVDISQRFFDRQD